MNEQAKKLLGMISDGVIIFEPRARSSKELLKFQEMAEQLLSLEREGLIGKCIVTDAEIAGQKYHDSVAVYQGITPRGEECLRRS